MMKRVLWVFAAVAAAACSAIPDPVARIERAQALAASKHWQSLAVDGGVFELLAFVSPPTPGDDSLTVYIEGDGFSWVGASMPSSDPTPLDPLALRLALAQQTGNVAYLARPCQFVGAAQSGCSRHYWTNGRFAPEVVDASAQAVEKLRRRFGARRLTLIGYSGGAAVAAMIAARRTDVRQLVTVAGNLDHRAWAVHHRVRPLAGSLNSIDFAEAIAGLPQIHFIGAQDRVIPPELALRWGEALLGRGLANLHVQQGFDHACCWAEHWGRLFGEVRPIPLRADQE